MNQIIDDLFSINELNLNRNPSNLIKQEKLFPKRTKTKITFISITLVPLIPTVYAKEFKPQLEIIEKPINELKDDKNENSENSKQSFTWLELWNLIKPHFVYFIISIMVS